MQTIKSRFPGEWTCTECDSRHNGYLPTQIWWRSKAPKVCWRCVQKELLKRGDAYARAFYIAMVLTVEGNHKLSRDEIRERLDGNSINPGYSNARLAAGVFRVLNEK